MSVWFATVWEAPVEIACLGGQMNPDRPVRPVQPRGQPEVQLRIQLAGCLIRHNDRHIDTDHRRTAAPSCGRTNGSGLDSRTSGIAERLTGNVASDGRRGFGSSTGTGSKFLNSSSISGRDVRCVT